MWRVVRSHGPLFGDRSDFVGQRFMPLKAQLGGQSTAGANKPVRITARRYFVHPRVDKLRGQLRREEHGGHVAAGMLCSQAHCRCCCRRGSDDSREQRRAHCCCSSVRYRSRVRAYVRVCLPVGCLVVDFWVCGPVSVWRTGWTDPHFI